MNFRRLPKEELEINLIPLIDVLLVIIRKMRITIITSISGTRLISSGSFTRPRWKFIYARSGG